MDRYEVFLNKCYEGNLCAISTLLSEGISPDVQNAEGETALQISAACGYLDIVKFLLSKDATIDLPNSFGWTPLMHAARHGHVDVVSFLIQMKAKVNVSNRLGLRPIDFAAWSGNLECVKLIMDAGAIIDNDKSLSNGHSGVCDFSPLIAASLQGYDCVVRTLLERGSAVNQASPVTGLTPVMLAAYGGYKSIVEILVEFGVDVNKTDIRGRSALHFASLGFKDNVIMFLEEITQPSSRKSSDEFAHDIDILRVVRSGDEGQVKSLLQLNQSLANYSDPEDGVTPLMTACMLGLKNIVELLLLHGADLNAQDLTNGWTPLMYAVFHRQTETVHLLLDKGVDIDIYTANGYTALDLAIHMDNSENNILNSLLNYLEPEEDTLYSSPPCSTINQNYLNAEKRHSRGDSQPRFREFLGGLSSHIRQFSKSSAISPIPDLETFDETLYDVFIDDDTKKVSPEKNFLCLTKFYGPNQHFAHVVKKQVVEALCVPPLPTYKNSIDLVKTICAKKDKGVKSISAKPHLNSLSVPNVLRKLKRKKVSSACSNISAINMHPESVNEQSIGDFPAKSVDDLKSSASLQLKQSFEFQENKSGVSGSVSECSTFKNNSKSSQEASKDSVDVNYKDLKQENNVVEDSAAGGLTALLSQGSLEKYAKKFRDQEIDLECFQYLTEDDLDEMGISSFNSRHKLMEIIGRLKNT